MKDTICAICGKPVAPQYAYTRHQKYCGDECRREAARIKARKYDQRRRELAKASGKTKNTLDEDMMEAERLKISYGKMMAQRYEMAKLEEESA